MTRQGSELMYCCFYQVKLISCVVCLTWNFHFRKVSCVACVLGNTFHPIVEL